MSSELTLEQRVYALGESGWSIIFSEVPIPERWCVLVIKID